MIVPIILMSIVVGVILFFGIKTFIVSKKTNKPTINGGGSGGGSVITKPSNNEIDKKHKEFEYKKIEKDIDFIEER